MKLHDRVQILNPEDMPVNDFGNPVPDWESAPSKTEPAEVSPVSSAEYTIGQDTTVSRWKLLLGKRTTARNDSRIHWRGDTYQVIGEVQMVVDHRGRSDHHEGILERVA